METWIRVIVDPTRVPMRVWLKTLDHAGRKTVTNVARVDVIEERNKLIDKLCASGEYAEVIGEPMQWALPSYQRRGLK